MDQLLCGIDDVLCSVLPVSRAGCLYMYCIAYCPRSAQMHWMNYYNKKIFYKNGKNVGMAQKGQKQEGMSCGEVFAVCGFYTQGYCTISLHLAAFCIMCYSLYGHIRTSDSCCSWCVAIATPPALSCK